MAHGLLDGPEDRPIGWTHASDLAIADAVNELADTVQFLIGRRRAGEGRTAMLGLPLCSFRQSS